ncbi:kinase domain protein [Ceratobasidium sp. AG-Ba]|nr:kinase domain protein [Ceratobasidium sp. AG-Ba]
MSPQSRLRGPEILRGERYTGPPQDVWAFGVVAYVLLVGECPFSSAQEAQMGLAPETKALEGLLERCGLGQENACVFISGCVQAADVENVMLSRYLVGASGWSEWNPPSEAVETK